MRIQIVDNFPFFHTSSSSPSLVHFGRLSTSSWIRTLYVPKNSPTVINFVWWPIWPAVLCPPPWALYRSCGPPSIQARTRREFQICHCQVPRGWWQLGGKSTGKMDSIHFVGVYFGLVLAKKLAEKTRTFVETILGVISVPSLRIPQPKHHVRRNFDPRINWISRHFYRCKLPRKNAS